MKIIMLLFSCLIFSTFSVAAEAGAASAEAGYFWHVLAGTGVLGTILVAVIKIVMNYLNPVISAWIAKHRLQTASNIIYDAVKGCYELYTKEYKAANADGKLTTEEIAFIRKECQNYIAAHMTHAGIDLIKAYGPVGIEKLCEMMLARIKSEEVRAALAPLSGLASAPLSDLIPAVPGVTGADFGLTTK